MDLGQELALAMSGGGSNFGMSLLNNENFIAGLAKQLGTVNKADTISQATNLMWYDLSRIVQQVYPYRELIPCLGTLPRVPGDGGNAFHWKRITSINPNAISSGVSEGNRGARIGITEQDMMAQFKTLGLESSTTFEARLAGKNLSPETLGIAVESTLRSLRINEEAILILGNASQPVGITPTPTLAHGTVTGQTGSFSGATYVACVALSGFGFINARTWNASAGIGGIPGQVTKENADGSVDTYGGGSAQPSAIATTTPTGTECITATVTAVVGALAYAWFVGAANSAASLYFIGVTPSNQAIFTAVPSSANQPLSSLYVAAAPQDNSTNQLVPDGVLTQVFTSVTGPDPGRFMSTNPSQTITNLTVTPSGSIKYAMPTANTGLTIQGSAVNEFDSVFNYAWQQYKLGFDKIYMSATDMQNTFGGMLNQASSNQYRILFDADEATGRIVAGRKVTSYMNKFTNKVLDVETHPFLPPGTVLFWSDRTPYDVSGVGNIIEAKVRQDYYQIQWPWRSRRYEYGVYVDETFPIYFCPAFAIITNVNGPLGTPVFTAGPNG